MSRVNPYFLCHQLSIILGACCIAQKKTKMGDEKRRAVKEETRKLLITHFIWEVHYPTWLANVVMVRMSNGRWRLCTDYTNLNKDCPKDPYPLPSIDRLVDGASDHGLLSFVDAYFGYNQIHMHPLDKSNAIQAKKCKSHLLEIDRLNVQGLDRRLSKVGYMLTRRVIKANPDKCEAIISMESLKA
ncbi:hypothetical protein CR513_23927, partial [Mucuna pruriens]